MSLLDSVYLASHVVLAIVAVAMLFLPWAVERDWERRNGR